MRKIFSIIVFAVLLFSCSKSELELTNPNEPGVDALTTEAGMTKAALGVYSSLRAVNDDYYFVWFVLTDHNIMGDATAVSAGNFAWRWANQVSSITLSTGSVLTPPTGGSQPDELDARNSRDYGSDNVYAHEWIPTYSLIAHCNLLLENIENTKFSGTQTEVLTKQNTYKSWLYWWKGFAYSRIGSIYSKAVIVNKYGEISSNFVSSADIISEAERNFELAKSLLTTIDEDDATYASIISNVIPAQMQLGSGGVITPSMFIRNINTYLARNILVNKYASDLTTSDLSEIKSLASNGIRSSDKIFVVRTSNNENTCLVYQTAWSPNRLLAGWENLSERLVQDFKQGDARFTRNVLKRGTPIYNPRGRGLSYGTRYTLTPIESGGDYATLQPELGELPMACTYEENQLMLAEVEIRTGNVDNGLVFIDNVRGFQNSGLSSLKGTGLTKNQALEELRRERRVGLFLKNTAFYDARRWGILKPTSEGGGRTKAVVVVNAAGAIDSATINYNYMEWFPVPANESDFNSPN